MQDGHHVDTTSEQDSEPVAQGFQGAQANLDLLLNYCTLTMVHTEHGIQGLQSWTAIIPLPTEYQCQPGRLSRHPHSIYWHDRGAALEHWYHPFHLVKLQQIPQTPYIDISEHWKGTCFSIKSETKKEKKDQPVHAQHNNGKANNTTNWNKWLCNAY